MARHGRQVGQLHLCPLAGHETILGGDRPGSGLTARTSITKTPIGCVVEGEVTCGGPVSQFALTVVYPQLSCENKTKTVSDRSKNAGLLPKTALLTCSCNPQRGWQNPCTCHGHCNACVRHLSQPYSTQDDRRLTWRRHSSDHTLAVADTRQ